MSKLIVEVASHTEEQKKAHKNIFAFCIVVFALALLFGIHPILVALALILILRIYLWLRPLKVNEIRPPEAHLLIFSDGIDIKQRNGFTKRILWPEFICIDNHRNGQENSLRLSLKNGSPKTIFFDEEFLSHKIDEILSFIHNICPYGRDISFWNTDRD